MIANEPRDSATDITDRAHRVVIAAACIAATLAGSAPVFSQDKPRDPVAAEALYLSGRKLVGEDKWAEGCEKFRASMELNPAASTMINIARCSEHDGKLIQALVDYRRALQLNQDTLGDERKRKLDEVVKESIAALESKLARVQLMVPNPPPGLQIKRDGRVLPAATIGETIPVEPGEHVFVVTAPGHRPEKRTVTVEQGERLDFEIKLVADPNADADATETPVEADKPSRRGIPAWAWAATAVGVVAGAGAVYFKLDQSNAEDQLLADCGQTLVCPHGYDPTELNERKNRSFGLFVGLGAAGIVALGVATVGFVKGSGSATPKKQSWLVAPYAGVNERGVVVQGAF